MINQKQLINLGFSEKEARVYLALLELGASSATEIARKSKINRTNSYGVLELLVSNGLVFLISDSKVQKYVAASPERVIKFLEEQIKKNQERLIEAQALLPQLLSVYNTKDKPHIKFFNGFDSMQEAFEDTLNASGEILAYAVGNDMFEAFSEKYFQDYFKKRVAKNISVRVIAPDDEGSKRVVFNDQNELRTTVLIPKDKFYFSVEKNIYDNKILIVSWKEKFAVIIESLEIADAQRKIFELAWLGAQNLKTVMIKK